MRTTATAIATRTAPRTSQRVRLQPARPCGCSRYVLIPLYNEAGAAAISSAPFSYAFLRHVLCAFLKERQERFFRRSVDAIDARLQTVVCLIESMDEGLESDRSRAVGPCSGHATARSGYADERT
jgi:hypothetical protein